MKVRPPSKTSPATPLSTRWRKPPWSHYARDLRPCFSSPTSPWDATEIPLLDSGRHDLRGFSQRGGRLFSKVVDAVDFSFASLPALDLRDAILRNVLFHHTNLDLLDTHSATFRSCVFEHQRFEGRDLGWRWMESFRPTFEKTEFRSCVFHYSGIRHAVIRHCVFTDVRFGTGHLGSFTCAFSGTRFENCLFERCTFYTCTIGPGAEHYRDGDFESCVFDSCVIKRDSVKGLRFPNCSSRGNPVLFIRHGYGSSLREVYTSLLKEASAKSLAPLRKRLDTVSDSECHFLTREDLDLPEALVETGWRLLRRFVKAA